MQSLFLIYATVLGGWKEMWSHGISLGKREVGLNFRSPVSVIMSESLLQHPRHDYRIESGVAGELGNCLESKSHSREEWN